MRMYDLIEKKKHGGILTRQELHEMIQGLSLIHISEPTRH